MIGRQITKHILTSVLLLLSFQTQASDSQFSAGFHIGATDMDVKSSYQFSSEPTASTGLGGFVRYRPIPNIVLELNLTSSTNFSLLGATDVYSLGNTDLMVGYELRWKKLKFTPKLGYSRWSLETTEGALFNSGPEKTKEIDGNDFIWGALVSMPFTQHFEMGLSHKRINPKFGRVDFTQLEFIVNF